MRYPSIAVVLAAVLCAAGCSLTASVPASDVEEKISSGLAEQIQDPAPLIACPDDLEAEVGATMQCIYTDTSTQTRYAVDVQVDGVDGDNVRYSYELSPEPLP